MKVLRELQVRGDDSSLRALVERLELEMVSRPESGWRPDREAEERVRSQSSNAVVCFTGPLQGTNQRVRMWLSWRHGVLVVSNVVPAGRGSLSISDYNAALRGFHDQWLVPASNELPVSILLSSDDYTPADSLGREVSSLLEAFASSAVDATRGHPADEERWANFVIAAHRNQVDIPSDRLERWLREDVGFADDVACDLAVRYEAERNLLRQFERTAA